MTPRLCLRCNKRPVSRKPDSRFCDVCTEKMFPRSYPESDEEDVFGRITRNNADFIRLTRRAEG